MKTEWLGADAAGIARAGLLLREGGLVALPTETVYGLAANALEKAAVAKIFEAKGRPQDNPLIVHISRIEQIKALVAAFPPVARALAAAYWPGPLTMVLPRSSLVPGEVSAGLSTVAVRLPGHPVARAVIEAAGVPLAAPSANLSGSPSPTSAGHVRADLWGKIDAILDGGDCGVGVESTVVSLTGEKPRLLRPGGITPAQIAAVAGGVEVDPAVTERLAEGRAAPSPGMKYKHYAPRARVILVRGNKQSYIEYVNAHAGPGVFALCFDEECPALAVKSLPYGHECDAVEQARNLFAALRRLDELGAREVYAHCPEPEGVGLAVYNRLIRAAAFTVVELKDR